MTIIQALQRLNSTLVDHVPNCVPWVLGNREGVRVESSYPHSEYLWARDERPSYSSYSPLFIGFSTIWFKLIVKPLHSSKTNLHHEKLQGNSSSTLFSWDANCTSWALNSKEGVRVENSYPHSEYLWIRDEWPSCSLYSSLFINFGVI